MYEETLYFRNSEEFKSPYKKLRRTLSAKTGERFRLKSQLKDNTNTNNMHVSPEQSKTVYLNQLYLRWKSHLFNPSIKEQKKQAECEFDKIELRERLTEVIIDQTHSKPIYFYSSDDNTDVELFSMCVRRCHRNAICKMIDSLEYDGQLNEFQYVVEDIMIEIKLKQIGIY
ncbi:unnamed protein product [Didymodactylos carnosus]|uniref:Uncharacterized protein n=2 Tax=Didymodactylos carnosus TaxID=1234261 RepID=A0A8S2E228_9BILA|nr:unnamed protein product [Didymodactylos carnosus]CAF3880824.1 unnamed protein product [Didymodactylos carnosus]